MTLTLADARAHLRIAAHDEDPLIERYIVTAHAAIERYIGATYTDDAELLQAERLLVATLFEDREGAEVKLAQGMPSGIAMLIAHRRRSTIA